MYVSYNDIHRLNISSNSSSTLASKLLYAVNTNGWWVIDTDGYTLRIWWKRTLLNTRIFRTLSWVLMYNDDCLFCFTTPRSWPLLTLTNIFASIFIKLFCTLFYNALGANSMSYKTPHRNISWNLANPRLVVRLFQSLWNLASASPTVAEAPVKIQNNILYMWFRLLLFVKRCKTLCDHDA